MTKKIQFPVHFSSVALQLEQSKIGIQIDRSNLSIETADELLSGRRLTGTVEVVRDGEKEDQQSLIQGTLSAVTASFDVKGFNVKPKTFTAGLVFAKDDMDPNNLDGFLKRNGRVTITENNDIPEDDDEE